MRKSISLTSFIVLCMLGVNAAAGIDWTNKETDLLSYGKTGKYTIETAQVPKIDKSKILLFMPVDRDHSTKTQEYLLEDYKEYAKSNNDSFITKFYGKPIDLIVNDGNMLCFKHDGTAVGYMYFPYKLNYYENTREGLPKKGGTGYIGAYNGDIVMCFENLSKNGQGDSWTPLFDLQIILCHDGSIKISFYKTSYTGMYTGEDEAWIKTWSEIEGSETEFNVYIKEGNRGFFSLNDYLLNYKNVTDYFKNGNNGILFNSNSKLDISFNIEPSSELLANSLIFVKMNGDNKTESFLLNSSAEDLKYHIEELDFSEGVSFYPILDSKYKCNWLIDGQLYTSDENLSNPNAALDLYENNITLNIVSKDEVHTYEVQASVVGSGKVYGTGEYKEKEYITISAEKAEGYEFSYWSGDVPNEYKNDAIVNLGEIYSDYDVTAHFVKTHYNFEVVCEPSDAGVVLPGIITVKSGDSITAKVTPNSDYQVKNWIYDGFDTTDEDNEFTINEVNHDIKLVVKLEPKKLHVNILKYNSSEGDVTLYPDTDNYNIGDVITITANANEGYKFDHWEGITGSTRKNQVNLQLTDDLNIKPVFEKLDCTLTLKVGANGSVRTDNGDVYGPGVYSLEYSAFDTPSFTAVPNTGYFLNSWSGDVSSGYTNSGTAVCNELVVGNNSVSVFFYKKDDVAKGEWNVDLATGDVIIDPVTGITELRGDGMDSSYEFIPEGAPVVNKNSVEFRVKFPEFYNVLVYCTTNEGVKCVTYTCDSEGYYAEDSDNAVYGLGENTAGSGWFTRTRNILVDLQVALGNTALQLESIDRMVFCGNGFVDYIKFVGDNDFPENWSRYSSSVVLGQVRNMEDSDTGKYFELYGPEEDYTYQASKYEPQLDAVSGFDVNWKMKYNPGELYRIVFRCIGDDRAVYFIVYTNDSSSFGEEETRFSVKNGDQYWAYKLLPDNEYGNWEEIIANLQETLLEAAPSDLPVSLQLTEIDHLYVRYHNICMTAPEFDAL